MDWEIRAKSARSFRFYEHAERERSDRDPRGTNSSSGVSIL